MLRIDRGLLENFLEYITDKENSDIVRTFKQDFFNPIQGYRIKTRLDTEKTKLTLVGNNLGGFDSVKVFKPWWAKDLPRVYERDGRISFEDMGFDFGEWDNAGGEVYFEFRAIPSTLGLIYGKEPSSFNFLNIAQLCSVVGFVMEKVIGKAGEIDPKVVLR